MRVHNTYIVYPTFQSVVDVQFEIKKEEFKKFSNVYAFILLDEVDLGHLAIPIDTIASDTFTYVLLLALSVWHVLLLGCSTRDSRSIIKQYRKEFSYYTAIARVKSGRRIRKVESEK